MSEIKCGLSDGAELLAAAGIAVNIEDSVTTLTVHPSEFVFVHLAGDIPFTPVRAEKTTAAADLAANAWSESAAQFEVPVSQQHSLLRAVAAVLKADEDFREHMPAGWEGDPLTDAIDGLRQKVKEMPPPSPAERMEGSVPGHSVDPASLLQDHGRKFSGSHSPCFGDAEFTDESDEPIAACELNGDVSGFDHSGSPLPANGTTEPADDLLTNLRVTSSIPVSRQPYDLRLQIGKALDHLVCDDSTPEQVDTFIESFREFGLTISHAPAVNMALLQATAEPLQSRNVLAEEEAHTDEDFAHSDRYHLRDAGTGHVQYPDGSGAGAPVDRREAGTRTDGTVPEAIRLSGFDGSAALTSPSRDKPSDAILALLDRSADDAWDVFVGSLSANDIARLRAALPPPPAQNMGGTQ